MKSEGAFSLIEKKEILNLDFNRKTETIEKITVKKELILKEMFRISFVITLGKLLTIFISALRMLRGKSIDSWADSKAMLSILMRSARAFVIAQPKIDIKRYKYCIFSLLVNFSLSLKKIQKLERRVLKMKI